MFIYALTFYYICGCVCAHGGGVYMSIKVCAWESDCVCICAWACVYLCASVCVWGRQMEMEVNDSNKVPYWHFHARRSSVKLNKLCQSPLFPSHVLLKKKSSTKESIVLFIQNVDGCEWTRFGDSLTESVICHVIFFLISFFFPVQPVACFSSAVREGGRERERARREREGGGNKKKE